jgi:hypothetical protein
MAKKKAVPQKPAEPQSKVVLEKSDADYAVESGKVYTLTIEEQTADNRTSGSSIRMTKFELILAFNEIAKVLSEREDGSPPILGGLFRDTPIAPYGERISFPIPSDRGGIGHIVFRHTQDDMIEVYSEAGRLTIEPQVSNVVHIGIVKED